MSAQPRSLAQLLLRKLLLAYVVLAISILALQLIVEYRSFRQGVIDTLQFQADTFAPGAAAALWEYQRNLLQSMVNGIGLHPAVVFVEIRDNTEGLGAVWRAPGNAVVSSDLKVQRPLYLTLGNGTRKLVGTLSIVSSERHLWLHLRREFLAILLGDLALLFPLGFALWWLVHRLAVRPLSRFSAQVKALSGEAAGHTINLGRENVAEMITLQQGFNQLMRQIGESHAQIARQNAELERKVAERTRDLEHKNRELVDAVARQQELTESLREAQIIAGLGNYSLEMRTGLFETSDVLDQLFGIDKAYERSVAGWMARIHPADRDMMDSYFRNEVLGRHQSFDKEYRIIRSDDQAERWIHGLGKLEFDALGQVVRMHGTAQDITERKLAEQQLRDSCRQLEEKELAKTRFLAAAGHDLRQPVAAANLFLDALKLTAQTQRQSELLERLDQSMRIFSGLLERLLDISKFDAGVIKPQIVPFNLAELFAWLEHNFGQAARDKQLRFLLCFPMNKPLVVRTDIGLLQSVVMNLVSNALKFTPRGGILIGARPRGDRVLLQVWDTGIGIAEPDIDHIFDEFFQAANPQRSREGGLGLGLSICQRAMTLLGCRVACRSRPGRGSVFELCLPLDGGGDRSVPPGFDTVPDEAAGALEIGGKRAVIVEDDALVAAGMTNLLQGLGAEVRHFPNAEEALRHGDTGDADFFVADYALGGALTGLQFLEAVQQRQQAPIRAIVLTGETSSQFIGKIASSPWPVLHKPVNYAKLASILFSSAASQTPD